MKKSLHEVLKKHTADTGKKDSDAGKETKTSNTHSIDPKPGNSQKHIVIRSKDAKALFLDLPKEHRFWTAHGREINNLTELYRSLIEMENDVFKHHVNARKDDFATWVEEILKDNVLARRLKGSRTKLDHVEIVKHRIDEIKGTGVRIPSPHSSLSPNFGFIRTDKNRTMKSNTPGNFSIRGSKLQPDTSFIQARKSHHTDAPRYDAILDNQEQLIDSSTRGTSERRHILEEMKEIRENYDKVAGSISTFRNELIAIKEELHRNRQQQQMADEHKLNEFKSTVSDLRSKEKDMLEQLKLIGRSEEKMLSKGDRLIEKEKALEEKESIIIKKETHYNTLMEKYDQMLKNIQGKMSEDEKKIQGLLNDVREAESAPPVPPSPKEDIRPDRLDSLEILDLIRETRHHIEMKHFDSAREKIGRLKELLKSGKLDKEFKKNAYFQVFELSTDLDLLQ